MSDGCNTINAGLITLGVMLGSFFCTEAMALDNNKSVCDISGYTQTLTGSLEQQDQSLEDAPERSSGYRFGMKAVRTNRFMIVTANPYASQVGCQVLAKGGSAIDAAVAVQAVLGLVEPQSSGLGGGGFLLYYDKKNDVLTAYDGREVAPKAVSRNYLTHISQVDDRAPLPNLRQSGRSIGVPGVVKMLELAHKEHGVLRWHDVLQPTVQLAQQGFHITPRFVRSVEANAQALMQNQSARRYFFDESGQVWKVGVLLKNPAYAETLKALAQFGSKVFYEGPLALQIVQEVQRTSDEQGRLYTPGVLDLEDLRSYQVVKRSAVCLIYRQQYDVCGMPAPSSGGVAIAQTLGVLEHFPLAKQPPRIQQEGALYPETQAVHWMTQSLNLAFADRNQFLGDWDYGFNAGINLPSSDQLLTSAYLAKRASLISSDHPMNQAQPGVFGTMDWVSGDHDTSNGTTHISIVDQYGNAVSFTSSVEGAYGSFRMVGGFMLNNQLTDFSLQHQDQQWVNRIEPRKRPRSSMAPTIVFEYNEESPARQLKMVTGSPGGAGIIEYTLKSLVAVLDWHLDPQQAAGLINVGARNGGDGGPPPVIVESDLPPPLDDVADRISQALTTEFSVPKNSVQRHSLNSGISTILVRKISQNLVLEGGADPRREGLVLGD